MMKLLYSQQQQEDLESSIVNLAKSINNSELPPILRLSSQEDNIGTDWRISYVSSNSFFENKTGIAFIMHRSFSLNVMSFVTMGPPPTGKGGDSRAKVWGNFLVSMQCRENDGVLT